MMAGRRGPAASVVVVAPCDGARSRETGKRAAESAAGDETAPPLARGRGADETERRGDQELEDETEQLVGNVVQRRRRRRHGSRTRSRLIMKALIFRDMIDYGYVYPSIILTSQTWRYVK